MRDCQVVQQFIEVIDAPGKTNVADSASTKSKEEDKYEKRERESVRERERKRERY